MLKVRRGAFPLGCRPFSAENCPLDSFPGAPNPHKLGMTPEGSALPDDDRGGGSDRVAGCTVDQRIFDAQGDREICAPAP